MSTTAGARRNYVYALCDLVHDACERAVNYRNIVNGFLAFDLWCTERQRPGPEVIT